MPTVTGVRLPRLGVSQTGSGPGLPPAELGARQARLESLCKMVQGCRACPRMEGRRRVLSAASGRAGADVMFVAEAPGRDGADRTGVPVHGDPSGNAFERMLDAVGWRRQDVYVTNAVLCNPRDAAGKNDTPTADELEACSHHLESTIRLVGPRVVATLGASALAALELIRPHGLVMRLAVARPHPWVGLTLFPLYHPSPRAMVSRGFSQQLADFRRLRELVGHMTGRAR